MSERRIQTVADMTSTDIADLLIRYTEQVERIAKLESAVNKLRMLSECVKVAMENLEVVLAELEGV